MSLQSGHVGSNVRIWDVPSRLEPARRQSRYHPHRNTSVEVAEVGLGPGTGRENPEIWEKVYFEERKEEEKSRNFHKSRLQLLPSESLLGMFCDMTFR